MAMLEVNNICKNGKEVYAVTNVSFSQQLGEKVAIAGETGSGKTTLLKMIGGLTQPDSGNILFKGSKVIGPFDQLIPGHAGIAYLSQHFELRNNYRVHEILEYANKISETAALNLYKLCRIEHLLERRTDQLSGGEKQRIALAKLLTGLPKLLLLDEPFSNLDAVHRNIIKSVINDISNKLKIDCIMVSHDAADVLSWADTILVLKEGKLIQKDNPKSIYSNPVNEYCAGLFGPYNLLQEALSSNIKALYNLKDDNRQMLLRPEHLSLAATGHEALQGRVEKILYWGSYYTVEILNEQQLITVYACQPNVSIGDSVYLSIEPAKITWM
ncbi:MAG: ABC transporter ATP-binding protein [Bacteroidota bacterium]